jgi:hypothetical protein
MQVPVLSSKDRFAQNRRESLVGTVLCCAAQVMHTAPAGKKLLKFAHSPVTQDTFVNEAFF